jgi:hypothetical protein
MDLIEREATPLRGFDAMIDLYIDLERQRKDEDYTPPDRWSASQLGYCMRRQFLRRKGVPETAPMDTTTLRRFQLGRLVERLVRSVYWRMGYGLAEEVHLIDEDLNVSGYVDLLASSTVNHDIPQEKESEWGPEWTEWIKKIRKQAEREFAGKLGEGNVGIEIKSTSSFAFKKFNTQGPSDHHMLQVGTYALIAERFPDQFSHPVDRWELLLVSKDDVKVLRYAVNEKWKERAQFRLASLNIMWEMGDMPKCECEGWMKNYCPYKEGDMCCEVAA